MSAPQSPVFRVVIPARFSSTRLPGKPLRLLAGKPMVQHVHERAVASGARQVIIATDHAAVAEACEAFGATVMMTDPAHASGTDRLAEVAVRCGWQDAEVVVNVQGDEPLLPSANVAQAASLLATDSGAAIATLATPIGSLHEFLDPNVVKVVCAANGRALYFSRAPIPWPRDTAPAGLASQSTWGSAHRHVGLYAYRVGALRQLAAWSPSPLELVERLEQLRAMENGLAIAVAEAVEVPGPGVDTPEDALVVERILAGQSR